MRAMKRATIKQVASEAQVSTQTVSRVINGRPDVSPETRIRVQQVIERLSYQPSAVARSLIGRRTYTLGVVASGLQYFGPSSTLTGIAFGGWSIRRATPASGAISREKRLKKWRRRWKIDLIEAANPEWEDLFPRVLS